MRTARIVNYATRLSLLGGVIAMGAALAAPGQSDDGRAGCYPLPTSTALQSALTKALICDPIGAQ